MSGKPLTPAAGTAANAATAAVTSNPVAGAGTGATGGAGAMPSAADAGGASATSSLPTVSLIAAVPETKPTCWQSFMKFVTCCIASTAPIIQAGIEWGVDEGAKALREKIMNDPNLTPEQKAALIKIGPGGVNAIAKGITNQIGAFAEAHKADANPHLVGLTTLATTTGVVDAFVPELAKRLPKPAEAGAGVAAATGGSSPATPGSDSSTKLPAHPVLTESMLKAGVARLAGKPGVADLSSAAGALVVPDKVFKGQVKAAVASSGLTQAQQNALLKSGAAEKFLMSAVLAKHNLDAAKKGLAEIAHAVPKATAEALAHHHDDAAAGVGGVHSHAVEVAVAGAMDASGDAAGHA